MALSSESRRALARGMGAYMRRTPATELPRSLRSIRNFNDKALLSQTAVLEKALGDEALRARILDWLKDAPSLSAEVRRTLEIAAHREDGWEGSLAETRSKPRTRKTSERTDAAAEVKEHKKRAASAQSELKRARAEARAEVTKVRRQRDNARKEADSLRARLAQAGSEVQAVERKLRAAEARVEREARRARSQSDEARDRQDSLRARVRDLRSENADLKKRLRVAEGSTKKSSAAKTSRKPVVPRERKRLSVPKGLLQDTRETLVAWLGRAGVTLVVDGYNVTKHEKGFGDVSLESQRDILIAEMQRLAARFPKVAMIVVFDGSEVPPGTTRRKKGGVKVEYSRPDEIADDHIVARVESLPPYPVVVVTSDRELQERVDKLDANVATSPQLLEVLRRA